MTTFEKYPTEVKTYRFDFSASPEIAEDGEFLVGTPTVVADSPGLTIGFPIIVGVGEVETDFHDGIGGTTYSLTCTCDTNMAHTLICKGSLRVNS